MQQSASPVSSSSDVGRQELVVAWRCDGAGCARAVAPLSPNRPSTTPPMSAPPACPPDYAKVSYIPPAWPSIRNYWKSPRVPIRDARASAGMRKCSNFHQRRQVIDEERLTLRYCGWRCTPRQLHIFSGCAHRICISRRRQIHYLLHVVALRTRLTGLGRRGARSQIDDRTALIWLSEARSSATVMGRSWIYSRISVRELALEAIGIPSDT